ncbi:MAG: right-handed parallel beta-helix repeat-containing protein [Thermoproteota archaeon]|nr:right-handed parallel beta-helix repeat-containing protein [Thermoproteota archaeon]
MSILGKNSILVAPGYAILLFLLIDLVTYQQQHLHFTAEAGEEGPCIDYESSENTIAINCNASFLDVVQTINDDPDILENLGNGEYILNANLEVADDVTFEMNSNEDGLQYLKITGANGIIVHGRIEISGIIITSWDTETDIPVSQTETGSVPRAFINLRESEGGFVQGSEIAYLGYQEFGRRGFDLFGDGPSHDLEIRGSKFHDMWFAFYSRGAYNITVDGNEYYNNIKYALDPHSGTHDMSITNNWLHHNPIGAICSDRCYNILIEENLVEHNTDHGIFFSRNMYDSIARNNHVSNTASGITVSESPNNQIYNNTIEGATGSGIRLFNPELPDDGVTENNLVYNNIISNSEDGISAARSHDNILENNMFSNIQSSEYSLSGDSSIIIRGQQFDNALITAEGSATENLIEIVDSGTIEVTEGETDGEEEEDDDGGEGDEEEGEGNLYNTDNEPFRRTLSDGDSITVESSS